MVEKINDFFTSSKRWHDMGHALFQFFLFVVLPWHGRVNLSICLLTIFLIELYQAKWKVREMVLKPDFYFDFMTHSIGIILALFAVKIYFDALV